MTAMTWLLVAAGLLLLFGGGEALVRGAVAAGVRLGISPLTAGLTIVAFGTSAPELMVNLRSVQIEEPGLAVGNVVGSNIANIGLILGLAILIRPARLSSRVVRKEVQVMMAATLLAVSFQLDSVITRWEGVALVTGVLAYVLYTVRAARGARADTQANFEKAVTSGQALSPARFLALVAGGLAGLVLGGHLLVMGAVTMATAIGVPPAVVGLSVVAIGTSLPELAASSVAAWRGFPDVAIGNVIGSNVFNLLCVLGATATLGPLPLGAVSRTDLGTLMLFSVLVLVMTRLNRRIHRWEGGLLTALFLSYLGWLLIT